ncbi:MAG TPA: universal stress protein [Solirubrobacteraceae bacterium]|nr:universal stress protein [Solirubrobacteraceae bacterium]
MTEIIVGIDDSPGALDALTFASRLALASGASLRLATAFPYSDTPSRVNVAAYRADLESDARKTLEAARVATEAAVSGIEAIADPSPARALHELSERIDAALVVVGSTRRGPLGRVVPGSTGERLLHGSPCPVAIVPRGYSTAALVRTIGVGYDGSDESEAALGAACLVARRFEAALRVIRVYDATLVGSPALMTVPGSYNVHEDFEAQQREGLDEAVRALPGELGAEPVFVAGPAGPELAAQSEQVDLMVVGSRGYGPRAAVLLGGVTHTLIRKAACPVVVLPRGSHGLEPLFGSTAGAATA